jgi:hypothetical protein
VLLEVRVLRYALEWYGRVDASWGRVCCPSGQVVDLPRHAVRNENSAVAGGSTYTTLAIEHGVPVVSGDPDFARFGETDWVNPLAP